jgi:hypothetical protein
MKVAHGGQHVVFDAIESGFRSRPTRLTGSAKVESQNTKTGFRENLRLFFSAFFVKLAPMRQHNASLALTINISIDDSAIGGWK